MVQYNNEIQKIQESLHSIYLKIINQKELEIKPNAIIKDIHNIDSVDYTEFLTSIEEKYNVQFYPELIEKLHTFEDFAKCVQELMEQDDSSK